MRATAAAAWKTIGQSLKDRLGDYERTVDVRSTGKVQFVGDGILHIDGLNDCKLGEMIELESGSFAIAMVTGYIPGRTATIATTVYQLWREGNDTLAYRWVLIDLAISMVVLIAVNLLEKRGGRKYAGSAN